MIEEKNEMKSTILIVDDQIIFIKILDGMLKDEYHIQSASNGKQAIDIAMGKDQPDLILLDIDIPQMNGFDICRNLKNNDKTKHIPIIFISAMNGTEDEVKGLELGAVDFIHKPFQFNIVKARIKTHLSLKLLDDLDSANKALQTAMRNLHTTRVSAGVYWVQIPEANLYILCGCPADVVKHLMKRGLISTVKKGDTMYENGPNAILLSDMMMQNGKFANLSEFPILQMFYRQGMIIPNHPGNTGERPILIGREDQVKSQMNYIYRGTYGMTSMEEIMEAGVSQELAQEIIEMKLKFAYGNIRATEEALDSVIVNKELIEIKNGVYIRRVDHNRYEFQYKGLSTIIDLNLQPRENYESPYELGYHEIEREYFAVIHSGEGNGWDVNRPSMGSVLMYQGEIYLIDAGPNILSTIRALGIDISEIKGVFHTHCHDDHFAGLPSLMRSDHKIKYYATPLVRESVARKLACLMNIQEQDFYQYFDVHDLELDKWNNLNGLEVKPLFSPHPVENNLFIFRTMGEDGYKSYAHWADLISQDLLKSMVSLPGKPGISQKFYEKVLEDYHYPADLKKLDIGGGMIHGQAGDFRNDLSGKIILAHKDVALSDIEKEVGSQAAFGVMDVLIPSYQTYLRKQAFSYLRDYFPSVLANQLQTLLNSKMVSFNPGTIIQKGGEQVQWVYLILAGSVEYIQSDSGIHNSLSNGSFVGEISILRKIPSVGTFRALSHVKALRFSSYQYQTFLEINGLYKEMNKIINHVQFLQKTSLFGEGISYPIQNKVAQVLKSLTVSDGQIVIPETIKSLYMVKSGEIQLVHPSGHISEKLGSGTYFGEQSFFSSEPFQFKVVATGITELYLIQDYSLLEIPIVHLKLLETLSKRKIILENVFPGL
ncbi:MAG: response regulator [Spirochaetaceae bacterium]